MGYITEALDTERVLFAGLLVVFVTIAELIGTVKGFFDCLQWLGNIVACNPRGYDATKRVEIKSFFVLFSLGAVWPAGRKLFSGDCNTGRVVQVARGGR